VLNGRYGPYVTNAKKNAKIPKGRDPKSLTLEECRVLIEQAPERGAGRFGRGRRGAAANRRPCEAGCPRRGGRWREGCQGQTAPAKSAAKGKNGAATAGAAGNGGTGGDAVNGAHGAGERPAKATAAKRTRPAKTAAKKAASSKHPLRGNQHPQRPRHRLRPRDEGCKHSGQSPARREVMANARWRSNPWTQPPKSAPPGPCHAC